MVRSNPTDLINPGLTQFSIKGVWLFYLLLLVGMISALSSCSSKTSRPDGPPNFYVDETRIHNAIPKALPLSKYGNKSKYRVFGKDYYVLKTHRGYKAVGTASWYGTKFHSRLTSSGEPYNMLSMTAAHKTLPLPTYVEVLNLANNRKIIVKVNDRGPFEGDRLIDLSYVAAKKLGMLGKGTAPVLITAIDPYTFGQRLHFAEKPQAKTFAYPYKKIIKEAEVKQLITQRHTRTLKTVKGTFTRVNETKFVRPKVIKHVYLQVGAFKDPKNAQRLKQKLTGFLKSPVIIMNPTSKVKLYRVQIGPLLDTKTADQLVTQLRGIGFNPNRTYGA